MTEAPQVGLILASTIKEAADARFPAQPEETVMPRIETAIGMNS